MTVPQPPPRGERLHGPIGARRRWSTTLSGETSYISGIATICWAMHPPGRGSSFIACRPRGVLKKGGCTPRQSSDPPILEQGTAGWVGHQSLDKTRRVETLPPGRTQMSEPLACAPTRCRQKTHGGCRLGGPTPRHTPRHTPRQSSDPSIIFNHIIRISRRDPYLSKWMMGRGPGCERAGWGRDPNHPEETRRLWAYEELENGWIGRQTSARTEPDGELGLDTRARKVRPRQARGYH